MGVMLGFSLNEFTHVGNCLPLFSEAFCSRSDGPGGVSLL